MSLPGFVFPSVASPYAGIIFGFLFQFSRFERLAPATQERIQFGQLGALVEHAYRRSPFWRARLESVGWAPGMPFDRAVFESLPPLTRRDLQDHFEDMKARPLDPAWGETSVASTSGSTGQAVSVERIDAQGLLFDAISMRDHLWHRRNVALKLGVIRRHKKSASLPNWGRPAAALFPTGPSSILDAWTSDIDSELEWLRTERPAYVVMHVGRALAGARLALERGIDDVRIQQIMTLGEVVTPEIRETVRRAFGAEIKDRYTCEEGGYLALQCPVENHYHVQSEAALIEIVDERLRPVAAGQFGRVLVTILHSFAMPLIRYDIGDVAVAGERCRCGRTLPVISQILGRVRNLARLPDGRLRYISIPSSHWLEIAPVREHRVVQRSQQAVEAELTCSIPLTDDQKQRIAAMVQRTFDYPMEVEVRQVEKIDWGRSGKREEFVRLESA